MPGRNATSASGYRYGFNGMEKDNEIKGANNSLDFGARIYDPRVGRWLSTDPLFKPNESTYSSFANNPIMFIDPNGKDTLIVHRSGPIAELSDGNSTFYLVTFSMISKGVETPLPGRMLMLSNAESEDALPHTSLPEETYILNVQDMPSHYQFNGNAIHVTEGVYIHAGNTYKDFAGCIGICVDTELTSWSYDDGTSVDGLGTNTKEAIKKIIDMRNFYDDYLTGDKFILKTNSSASEMQKMKPKTIDKIPNITKEMTLKTYE